MSLEAFLDDLARLRSNIGSGPSSERAVFVRCSREPVGLLALPAGRPQADLRIYASKAPRMSDRSVLRVQIDPDGLLDGAELAGVGVLYGVVAPGRAIVCRIGDSLLWPVGPARPEIRGRRWRLPA